MADDPVLEFLMQWVLEFGTGSDNIQRRGWQPYRDTRITLGQPPVDTLFTRGVESALSSQCSYRINQAGLDYIKNGHGQMSESTTKEN